MTTDRRAPATADVALLVIAKEPRAGRVKTRLCPPCSPEQAARLAEAALRDTLTAVAGTPARRRVVVLDGAPGPWLPAGLEVVAQVGGGLDARLTGAFAAVDGPALLVGMDTPQVTPALLAAAAAELLTAPGGSVLGPAADGGWWAVGFQRPDARAFTGVPMSTADTCARQRERLAAIGAPAAELPVLVDVDTWTEVEHVARLAPDTRFAAAAQQVGSELDHRAARERASVTR